jgi:hypothetical protein
MAKKHGAAFTGIRVHPRLSSLPGLALHLAATRGEAGPVHEADKNVRAPVESANCRRAD